MSGFYDAVTQLIPSVRRFAVAVTQDRDTADDLVRAALNRAVNRQNEFLNGTNLRVKLFAIMHAVLADHTSRDARIDQAGQQRRISPSELEILLARLPFEQRAALMLVMLEGFSYVEAAEITGVEVDAVRSRVSKAREALYRETSVVEKGPKSGTLASQDHVGRIERIS